MKPLKSSVHSVSDELLIIDNAADMLQKKLGRHLQTNNNLMAINAIVQNFLKTNKTVVFGGLAINNLLPENERFYNTDTETPDYDIYSSSALMHAKLLCDILYKSGHKIVEARSSALHPEVYKIFVNFIPIVDLVQYDKYVFDILYDDSVKSEGINYASPDYLRLNVYKEFAAPNEDPTRWNKIYTRLNLLNKFHPFIENENCSMTKFTRDFVGDDVVKNNAYNIVKNTLMKEDVIFLGAFACNLYKKYNNKNKSVGIKSDNPDFEVLSTIPKIVANNVKENLKKNGFINIWIVRHLTASQKISTRYEIFIDQNSICVIYEPTNGCYGYNSLMINNKKVNIATIDTMLFFLIALRYVSTKEYNINRVMCMAQFMFHIQNENILNQKGIFKRFDVDCYGNNKTFYDKKGDRAILYNNLKRRKNSKKDIYDKYFFKYNPGEDGDFTNTNTNTNNTNNTNNNNTNNNNTNNTNTNNNNTNNTNTNNSNRNRYRSYTPVGYSTRRYKHHKKKTSSTHKKRKGFFGTFF